jgi:hypothetical protein
MTVTVLAYGILASGAVFVRWLVMRYLGGRGYRAEIVERVEGEN